MLEKKLLIKSDASVRLIARPAETRPPAKQVARPTQAATPPAKASGDDSGWRAF